MGKHQEHQSFAEMVEEVKTAPANLVAADDSRRSGGDTIVDPDGRRYLRVAREVSSSRAQELAANGAMVAWDRCGCGGFCGLTWYDRDAVARMVASGPPRIRHKKRKRGKISEWHAAHGTDLLLAEGSVCWSGLLA